MENGDNFRDNEQPEDETFSSPEPKKKKLSHFEDNHHLEASEMPDRLKTPKEEEEEDLEVKRAYEDKDYARLLKLLQEDRTFPKAFKIKDIDLSTIDGKKLKEFVQDRNKLHKLIQEDKFEDMGKIECLNIGTLHLNTKNESARFAALKHEKYYAYVYLRVIYNADFKDEKEAKAFESLPVEKREKLKKILNELTLSTEKKHINFLCNYSHCWLKDKKGEKDNLSKIRCMFEDINKIPEIEATLKVLQYSTYLDITFDFNRTCVDHCPRNAKANVRGITKIPEGIIYIAAETNSIRKRNKVLGTTAHECTHMALGKFFDYNGYPYKRNDKEDERRFNDIMKEIREKKISDVGEDQDLDPPLNVLKKVFENYNSFDHPSELIVVVPQLLAEDERYREKLNKDFPELMAFYQEIIEKFNQFVENPSRIPFRRKLEDFNKFEGELDNLMNLKMVFKDLKKHDFLDMSDVNVLVIQAESTKLTMLRTLQRLYGENYCKYSDRFAVLNFKKLETSSRLMDCLKTTAVVEAMIVEFDSSDVTDVEINNAVNTITDIFEKREELKIVVIVPRDEERIAECLTGRKSCKVIEEIDENFSLNDLDDVSIANFLQRRISFQGQEMLIRDLLVKDGNMMNTISVNIMGAVCSEEKIEIGGIVRGTSSLEGAYTDVIDEIDFYSFCRKINFSDNMFIICGLTGERKSEQFYKILNDRIDAEKVKFPEKFEGFKLKPYDGEKIHCADFELSADRFKEFCHLHSDKKIYLINVTSQQDGKIVFILKQYYNPHFYAEREFKCNICKDSRVDLIKFLGEINKEEEKDDKSNKKKKEKEHLIISDAKRGVVVQNYVYFLDGEEAKKKFEQLSNENKIVHWFSNEEDSTLFWKCSNKSIENIRKKIGTGTGNKKKLLNEVQLVHEIENKKIVLIADEPGMGKSTTVTKLYERKINGRSISEKNWLIRINLREHLEAIKVIDPNEFDNKKLIGFLTDIDKNLRKELNQNFLDLSISSERFPKPLLLILDGFDEITNEMDRQKIKILLKYLKEKTVCKIWITTRPNFKLELEKELVTIAVEFEPMDDKSKRTFIKNYLNHRFDLILLEWKIKLEESNFTKALLTSLNKIFPKEKKDKVPEKFISTPLQLYLMLNISIDSFKNHILEGDPFADYYFSGENIIQVYSKFLEMKYEVFLKKVMERKTVELLKEISRDFFNVFNKNLAESILFSNFEFSDFLEKHKSLMLATGILKSSEGSLEFIHITFREYYSAELILEYLKDERYGRKLNFRIIYILISEIFLTKGFELLRRFLNLHLEKLDFSQLPEDNLKHIGDAIATFWGRDTIFKNNKGTVLHVAVTEKNITTIKFIMYCCEKAGLSSVEYLKFLKMVNSSFRTVFQVAAGIKDTIVFRVLLEEVKSLKSSPKVLKELLQYKLKGSTPLQIAKDKKYSEISQIIESELQFL